MKHKALILSNLISVLVVVACQPSPPQPDTPTPAAINTPTPMPTNTPDLGVDPGFNILVAAEGEVQLKRAAWSGFHATAFGAVLERGDLLQLPRGAKAAILCDGLTLWQVPAGTFGLTMGCPQPLDKILVRGNAGSTSIQRGTNDPIIPYIISPRATKLLNDKPTLRWNDSGATSYTVQVRGGDLNWVKENVIGTELAYPGDPALEPGVFYLLVVQDSNGRSSQEEGRKGLGFSLLKEDEAEKLQANTDRIGGLDLPSEGEAFALAQLYAGHGLIAKAVQILEGLIEDGCQQVAVHQALADLYAQIGLALLAEPRYVEALKLAEAQGNVEALAAIQASLGEVYVTLNNTDEAIRWLTQAQAGYEALGDIQRASGLEEQILRLSK
jgi:hypothetical protein